MTEVFDQVQVALGAAYRLECELSRGGMSRVFVAQEVALGRRVVVKVLSPDLTEGVHVERFLREIRLAANLQHPNIVPLLATGVAGHLPFYTMPLVQGESLRDRVSACGALSIDEASRLLADVASALTYAHERGIVHRDIKPENILISSGRALVADFGIAKALEALHASPQERITGTGASIGTPAYMAPEQIVGDPAIDQRADIYSLGCVAYELLSGAPPFNDETPQAILAAHLTREAAPISSRRRDIPVPLAVFIARALAKDPAARPPTLRDLTLISGEQSSSTSGISARRTLRGSSRIVIAAVSGCLLLVVWYMLQRFRTAGPEVHTIAVLPFQTVSSSDAPLADGMATEIADALEHLNALQVKASTLVRQAASTESNPQRIGNALGVGSVLLGTVQRDGNRVRVTAQLMNVADGFSQWSGKYDFDFRDVFAVQDTIARAIATELQIRLAPSQQRQLVRAATTNPEAHTLYLQGLYLWNKRKSSEIARAIQRFEQASALDPHYAQPLAGMAMAHAILPYYADINNEQSYRRAEISARAALAIDSTSVEAHTALGFVQAVLFHYDSAEHEFDRALALDSTFATAHEWRSFPLALSGHLQQAVREAQRALELDPQSRAAATVVTSQLYEMRDYPAAEAVMRSTIALDSAFPTAYRSLALVLIAEGRSREAVEAAQESLRRAGERLSWNAAVLGIAYAADGEPARARQVLAELTGRYSSEAVHPIGLALLCDALGDRETALHWLAIGVQAHDVILMNWSRGQLFDGLRSDPRGAAILASVVPGKPER